MTACFQARPLVGDSLQMSNVKAYLRKLARTDSHVLITGETGTGKELATQYIHEHSSRQPRPLITLNCAAIPDALLESELFGYERGAFTGALSSYSGKLKLADGGTVLFDEIGDMSLYAQAKILRVIETKEIYPLGGRRSIPLDIRIIAATNRDLEQLTARAEFRQDLYYRFCVGQVRLPPLRERRDDIPILINYYMEKCSVKYGREIVGVSEEAMESLWRYEWPGNVRELINFVERTFIDPPMSKLTVSDLPPLMHHSALMRPDTSQAERDLLLRALIQTRWNKSKAAERLNWSRMTLYRKIAKYHIAEHAEAAASCNKCSDSAT